MVVKSTSRCFSFFVGLSVSKGHVRVAPSTDEICEFVRKIGKKVVTYPCDMLMLKVRSVRECLRLKSYFQGRQKRLKVLT